MEWWDSVLETGGELWDSALETGEEIFNAKAEQEVKKAESDPDEQRKNNNDYQQPNGEPVTQIVPTLPDMKWVMYGVGAVLVVVLLVMLATRS
ncbi:hypothetical protein HGP28_10690 [Vibrio sp. SM6]|uniref:Uncharacterized protein n=1 Tax=Vibrio agarilyticus TaxID=2726741 RepID=A0A7X8YH44_9VIBR|nr:hypothetical protein [Vibrio agarilyticus]NLS13359.1 hypothetical protein [Vibrio agarilyticus]